MNYFPEELFDKYNDEENRSREEIIPYIPETEEDRLFWEEWRKRTCQ